ncbi:hypothetical protein A0257_16910 [Hymenobacter psoromatis]|nr:hypothetical protein A0257_16910 [Hymenobacter psoromatis]
MFSATLLHAVLPDRYRRAIVLGFFGLLLAGGLGLVRDYGVSFDEGTQRILGQISLLYVFQQLPTPVQQRLLPPGAAAVIAQKGAGRQLKDTRDRDYGMAFELPVAAAEQALRLRDERQVYLFRHGCNFLVCFAAFIGFYHLIRQRFGSWRLGLLSTLLLVLSPRLFADYFYNDKDAVFMAAFVLAMSTAVAFIGRPTARAAAWHALACALAIDVRIMGVLLPAATLAFVGLRAWRGAYRGQGTAPLAAVWLYAGLLAGLVVACWPFLWEAPLANFLLAFQNMSHFRWSGVVLYQGQVLTGRSLPWHYAPVWMGLTTPPLYLGLFGIGFGAILGRAARRRWQLFSSATEWQDLFFLGVGLAPLVAVIALHSVLYNGWRQLYFTYPPLLLVALRGLVAAWFWRPAWPLLRRGWRPAVGALTAVSLAATAGSMARLHPFENLYFNALAPANPERYYDTDYWFMSTRSGLEWVLQHDPRPQVRIYQLGKIEESLNLNRFILPPAARARLVLVPTLAAADYALYPYPYTYQRAAPGPTPCHSVQAGQLRMLDVFCLRPAPTPSPRAAGRAGE